MDTQIEEIIFLPSLRCNLNCKHCGEKQDIGKTEEIDCDLVLEQIQKSCLFHGTSVQISGGEPFLNDTFQNFLVRGLRETRLFFYITSNGYFYEKIMNVINQITPHERQRLGFSISVDGFEKTHNHIRRNSISYQNAITTVKHLVEQDVPVSINTVAQPQNLDELQKMTEFVHGISPKVGHSVIPLALDISEDDKEEYTDQYTDVVWKYVTSIADKKRLLSKGKFGVKKCHAGMKNIVIASNGGGISMSDRCIL